MGYAGYEQEMAQACALARRAGNAALAYYGREAEIEHKPDGMGPVTLADKAANKVLVDGLRSAFPGDAILAEESAETHPPATRQRASRLWCIDPIDGTREFIDQTGQFVVMVGLAVDGRATLGVVHDPLSDVMWRGVLGHAGMAVAEVETMGQTKPLRPSRVAEPKEATVVVSRHGAGKAVMGLCQRLGIHRLQPLGSVGLKAAWVASGRADAYVCATDKVHEWDTCGPEAILRAAGGAVTDVFGAPLRYNKDVTRTLSGMLATNGALHGVLTRSLIEQVPQSSPLRRAQQR